MANSGSPVGKKTCLLVKVNFHSQQKTEGLDYPSEVVIMLIFWGNHCHLSEQQAHTCTTWPRAKRINQMDEKIQNIE